MKVLVFGKNGQIAWELERSLAIVGEVRCVSSSEGNFSSPEVVRNIVQSYKPTHIVNAAAYTLVDKAETEAASATIINGTTVGVLAEEAKKVGAFLLHYSTDYVFDGSKGAPYEESDPTAPLNVYGKSKLVGEQLIQQVGGDYVVLRVSWVYGNRGVNFYRTMLRLGMERDELAIVSDQIGAPTWCRHISDASSLILKDNSLKDKSGIYHLSPTGQTSWCDFAKKIFELNRKFKVDLPLKVQSINEISSKDYVTLAKRPLNSRLNSTKLRNTFGITLPSWEASLELVVRG